MVVESNEASAAAGGKSKSFTRYLPAAARIFMGLVFFVFGLNGILNFIPVPPNLPDRMMAFQNAMKNTGFMLPLVGATQVAVGVLLLLNRLVPLALVMIAPVIVNIIMFHIFLQPAGLPPGLVVLALEIYLVKSYWKPLRGIFTVRAAPNSK